MANIIKKGLVDIAKNNTWLRKKFRKIVHVKNAIFINRCQRKYDVDEKIVIFECYQGRSYTCSPKAIYEEMIGDSRFDDFTFVWSFKKPHEFVSCENLKKSKIIMYGSKDYYIYNAKAKYIVTNSISEKITTVRDNQIYIQTWHGTPLKKLGFDLETKKGNSTNSLSEIRNRYAEEARKINYMISPSKFTSDKLNSSFKLDEYNNKSKILEIGYPRNDYLFKYNEDDTNEIKNKLGLNKDIEKDIDDKKCDKKIILFAPTFRDNKHDSANGYKYELGFQIENLKKQLGEDFIILFRTHYFVTNSIDFEKYKDFLLDVSSYPEINDLYIVSDMLITDYSSVFFDYACLKKPIIFYMYDLEEYRDDIRGFYLSLDELPGEIVYNEIDLISCITKYSTGKQTTMPKVFDDKYKKFNEKYNYLEDGMASWRVLEECFDVKNT